MSVTPFDLTQIKSDPPEKKIKVFPYSTGKFLQHIYLIWKLFYKKRWYIFCFEIITLLNFLMDPYQKDPDKPGEMWRIQINQLLKVGFN